MFPQLESYKNPSLKLKTILQALYDQVKANRNLAHFFLSVHSETLILDVQKFSHFVMVKPEQLYREPLRAQKSSMPGIQVTSTVFEEIYKILVQVLKDIKMEVYLEHQERLHGLHLIMMVLVQDYFMHLLMEIQQV